MLGFSKYTLLWVICDLVVVLTRLLIFQILILMILQINHSVGDLL